MGEPEYPLATHGGRRNQRAGLPTSTSHRSIIRTAQSRIIWRPSNPNPAPSRARRIVKRGTVIYSTVRPYLLNIAIVEREFDYEPIASTAFAVVHPWEGVDRRYLYHYLRSPWFIKYAESVQIGMAYPAISDEKFYSGLIPLPPTEEQSYIVSKVDELMALCDRLETQREAGRKLQIASRRTSMQAVANSTNSRDLQTTWTRLADNFVHLFGSPEDMDELVAELMTLAARGLLVENSTNSPNLEAIKYECSSLRERYIDRGLMRRQKLVGMTGESDSNLKPNEPASWRAA